MDKEKGTSETDKNSAEGSKIQLKSIGIKRHSITLESEDEQSVDSKRSNIRASPVPSPSPSCNSNDNSKHSNSNNSSNNIDKKSKQNKQEKENRINKEDASSDEEKKEQSFRVTTTNSGFKLRIVPLEKLLEKPIKQNSQPDLPPAKKPRQKPQPELQQQPQKRLPERSNRKNYTIIDISDSSEENEEEEKEEEKKKEKQQQQPKEEEKEEEKKKEKQQQQPKENLSSKVLGEVVNLKRLSTKRKDSASSSTTGLTSASITNHASTTDEVKENNNNNSNNIQLFKLKRCVVRLKRTRLTPTTRTTKPTSSSESTAGSVSAPQRSSVQSKTRQRNLNGSKMNSSLLVEKATNSTVRNRGKQVTTDDSDDSDCNTAKEKTLVTSDGDSDFVAKNIAEETDEDQAKVKKDSKRKTKKSAKVEESDTSKSSDSEIMPMPKKRVFNKRKRNSSSNDSDFEPKEKPLKKKRGRVKKQSTDESDDDDDDDDDEKNKNKRKHIRKIIKTKDLDISTKTATKEEEDRRKRIEERQKLYNQIYEKPESVEVTDLVLDFDEETKEPLLEVDKGLLKKLKPHQVAGVKFMWDASFETLQDALNKPGSGCILAHCMGLGKTLQIVTLSHTLLSNGSKTGVERVLIISPLSTLNNWAREFHQWMAFTRKKNIEVYDMSKFKDKQTRIFKLNEWYEEGGVCILGYDMYRILANEKAKGLRKKQRETLQNALVEPGPDLVVCDEGHLLKNEKTSISKAVTRMRTRRRIVLTGTPLQNNLKEYYCMIQFIKPSLLGTYKEYLNRFVNPITNGQYTDSTERDIRLMKHRSHILHKLLEGCIQRRDYSVLSPYLPPKHEYVVYTTLSVLQELLYEFYMTTQRDMSSSDIGGKGARLFQDFQDLRRIWTHPLSLRMNSDTVIRKRLLADSDSMEDFIDDDDDEEASDGSSSNAGSADSSKSFTSRVRLPARGGARGTVNTRNSKPTDVIDFEEMPNPDNAEKDDPSEWWKRFVADKELNNLNHSPKLMILMRLLEQCEAIGDKLLVFSQSLQSLDVIEHFLALIDSKTKGSEIEGDIGDLKGLWTPGKDYFRLDGSCSVEHREAMCKKFNDATNLRSRLFLISTRAGGLGINLVAANRVVIFDVSWNPSHDTQSIFRVYRFGQDKPCYIYRLIAMGTMEQKVYERQVAKQATAKRVIDEQQISRHYNQSDLQELYTYELKPSADREVPNLPKDRLFAELLSERECLIFKYHEHDSLLENEESENLSEAERTAAWNEYEAEKTRSVQTAQFMSYDRGGFGAQFGNASGSVTSNKIFGFRSDVLLQLLNMKITQDQPELTQNQVIQMVPTYLQRLYNEMNNGDPTMYKDLLTLHATLAHPSGMYMNPLLYANQNPLAAGYYQNPAVQQPGADGVLPTPMPMLASALAAEQSAAVPVMVPTLAPTLVPGFDPNQVYEID